MHVILMDIYDNEPVASKKQMEISISCLVIMLE